MHKNSVYCAKPENRIDENRMSYNFTSEATALGAGIKTTASGFSDIIPFVNLPEQLQNMPRLSESGKIKDALAEIGTQAKNNVFMAGAIAPYSLLTMVSVSNFYEWLIRYPVLVTSALNFLAGELAWYISEMFRAGAKIVSLSDPYAQQELIGAARFHEFCAASQINLLKQIGRRREKGVVHLCPYCFTTLEEYGHINLKEARAAGGPYEQALLKAADEASETFFIGRTCPHIKYTDYIYYFSIGGEI
jgi:uroporphyrinogen-III decarboxylase